jgi:hypothetical protein
MRKSECRPQASCNLTMFASWKQLDPRTPSFLLFRNVKLKSMTISIMGLRVTGSSAGCGDVGDVEGRGGCLRHHLPFFHACDLVPSAQMLSSPLLRFTVILIIIATAISPCLKKAKARSQAVDIRRSRGSVFQLSSLCHDFYPPGVVERK